MSVRVLLLALCAFASFPAFASQVTLVETGDVRASSTPIDSFFTLPPPADVFDEPPFPTATVQGELTSDVDVDWVSFTGRGGQIVYADSDQYPLLVDTALYLFDSAGTLIATADDSLPIDLGSEFELDAFLGVFVLPRDGTYYLAISSWTRVPATASDSAVPLFRPDGGQGGFAVVGAEPGNDVFEGLVQPIDQNAYTVHLTLGKGLCGMDLTFTTGTLRLDFDLATPDPVTWNLWITAANVTSPLWSVAIPTVETRTKLAVPIPGFPSIGTIGFLTTFTDSSGIVCSAWKAVSTSASLATTLPLEAGTGSKKRPRRP